jgi:hypothetical protein
MKKLGFALVLLLGAPVGAELPSYGGWPHCVPILGFTHDEIGVAAFETFPGPKPVQRWVCRVIDRATLLVIPVEEADFDKRFPGIRQEGNHGSNDCQEMTKTVVSPPPPGNAPPPTCIDSRVLCSGKEIPVAVGSADTAVRCFGQLFSAATMIDGNLWMAVNPRDIYFRDLDGSGVLVQNLSTRAVLVRRSSVSIGGRSVCAIRKDPESGHIWATSEAGLVEMRADGAVIRQLKFRPGRQPMETIQKRN